MKERFTIAVCTVVGQMECRVTGHVYDDIGVHKRRNVFVVSHIPSGRALAILPDERKACRVARRIRDEVPLESFPDEPYPVRHYALIDSTAFDALQRIAGDVAMGAV